jgi:hypothetical protein
MRSHHTNNTFGFCRHTNNRPEKTKRVISCQPAGLVLFLNYNELTEDEIEPIEKNI